MRFGTQAILPQYAGGQLRYITHRNHRRITALVYHRMLGNLNGTDDWFRDRRSGRTSTHWGIGYMSWLDRLARRAQTRQWVDSNWTAYGWSARPTDTPTIYARQALGHDLYNASADLNWQVLHVEVEGNYDDPWPASFIAQAKKLEAAISAAHGPVYRLFHTDCSTKRCPGAETFPASQLGARGKRLGSVPKPPAPKPPPSEAVLEMSVLAAIVRNTPQPATVVGGASLYKYPGRNQPYWDPEVTGSLAVEVIGGVQSLDGTGFWRVLRVPETNARGIFFAHSNDVKFR